MSMDKLSDLKYTMESCNHCGQCKWIMPARMHGWDFADMCPIHSYHGFDAYSGQGLLNIARERMEGKLEYGEGLEDLIYSCTDCGACDACCKVVRDMEVTDTIYALRADCAEHGTLPAPVLETAEKVKNTHNIYGLPHSERFAWLPEGFEDDPDADTALFVGCSAYKQPEIALAAIRILKAGGVRFKLLREDEWCCGAPIWRAGMEKEAQALLERNVDCFRTHGIKTVITACGECFGSFRNGYPRFVETDFETLHISQVAARLIEDGKLRLCEGDPVVVTYHDPCMLGRHSEVYVPWKGEIRPFGLLVPEKQWRRGEHGVYDAPRKILEAMPGVTLKEMVRSKECGFCCGAPSVQTDPELAEWTRAERRREAAATGADTIVSACPFCCEALDGEEGPNCVELCVLLAQRLGEEC